MVHLRRPTLLAAAPTAVAALLAALLALLAAGCWQKVGSDPADLEPGDDGPGLPPAAECVVDVDCVAAASSCCDCPAYALPISSGYGASCGDVECPAPADCPLVMPACRGGACSLVCAPVRCDLVCDDGFAIDAAGCLQCACAAPGGQLDRCDSDADCVRVPADCCGCALGGADTAVPAGEVDTFHEALRCDSMPSCPGVDVCDPSEVPRCVVGGCSLVPTPTTDGPADGGVAEDPDGGAGAPLALCGTSASPTCPAGLVCVLNDPAAADAGIDNSGICVPAGG